MDGRLKVRNSFWDGRNRTASITEKLIPILESDTPTKMCKYV